MTSIHFNNAEMDIRKILVVDDNESIHHDIRKLLMIEQENELKSLENQLFGNEYAQKQQQVQSELESVSYDIDSAYQGREGLEMIRQANQNRSPYAMVFLDIRMPPGWDGLKTAIEIRKIDPTIQIVMCTAFSDYSWNDLTAKLGHSSSLLVLKKPFDTIEVQQLALALTEKWKLTMSANLKMNDLQELVEEQTETVIKTRRQKDEFLSSFSHELRTPLAAITGYARRLIQGDSTGLSDAQTRSAMEIQANGQTLLGMVNDLLDLARFDSNDKSLTKESISTVQLIDSVLRILTPHRERQDIRIETHHDPSANNLVGDRIKLKQALTNIIFNAIKYSTPGTVIKIRTEKRSDGFIAINVKDQGTGIDKTDLPYIFDRYYQSEPVKKECKGGVGLGLTVAMNLAKLHGGNIEVESNYGEGSLFRLIVPQGSPDKQPELSTSLAKKNHTTREENKLPPLHGLKILVVDDNAMNRELISSMLNELGGETIIASNGSEGISSALKNKPDVILMDIMMPVMNGIEATRRIKQAELLFSVPVIAVTATVDNTSVMEAKEAGCYACTHKPVREKVLKDLILSATRSKLH